MGRSMKPLFHICAEDAWEDQFDQLEFRDPSLEAEGFIHCSFQDQVAGVASRIFSGRDDLLLMEIKPDLVTAEIKVEDSYNAGVEYPHIYGPIPLGAVRRVYRLQTPSDAAELPWPSDADVVFSRTI